MKKTITNDLKVKYDLLEWLGFKINRNLDYRHICGQLRSESYDEQMFSMIQKIEKK